MKDLMQANSFINMILDVVHHLSLGRKIYAIKAYRDWAECQDEYYSGLKECKEFVELFQVRLMEMGALRNKLRGVEIEAYETLWAGNTSNAEVVDLAKALVKSSQFMKQEEITVKREDLIELRNMIDRLIDKN